MVHARRELGSENKGTDQRGVHGVLHDLRGVIAYVELFAVNECVDVSLTKTLIHWDGNGFFVGACVTYENRIVAIHNKERMVVDGEGCGVAVMREFRKSGLGRTKNSTEERRSTVSCVGTGTGDGCRVSTNHAL